MTHGVLFFLICIAQPLPGATKSDSPGVGRGHVLNPKVLLQEQKTATMSLPPPLAEPLWNNLRRSQSSEKTPTYRRDSTSVEPRCAHDASARCSTKSNKADNIWLFGEGVEVVSQKHWGECGRW